MAPLDPVDLKTNREVVPVIQLIQFIYILGQRTRLSESKSQLVPLLGVYPSPLVLCACGEATWACLLS